MNTNALLSNKSSEHYTPPEIISAVKELFGGSIHLDPGSCEIANQIVGAEQYYAIENDALARPWITNNLFLNPPSSSIFDGKKIGATFWFKKLLREYYSGNVREAIYLAFSIEQISVDMLKFPVCFTDRTATNSAVTGSGRLRFLSQDLKPQGSPTHRNAICYLNRDDLEKTRRFYQLFSQFGICGKFLQY